MRSLWLHTAFGLLSLALVISRGQWNLLALLLVILTFSITLGLIAFRMEEHTNPGDSRLLIVIIAGQFLALVSRPDQVLINAEAFLPTFQLGIGVAALLTLSYLGPWMFRGRFATLLVLYCLLAGGLIHTYPTPAVDVWIFQNEGVRHLLAGENPYAATYPNPYPHSRFHGPEILVNGRIQSCPYPPLSLLLVVPGYLVGDIRWSLLAALAGMAVLMVLVGRRLEQRPGHAAELSVIALLFTPAGFPLLQLGWTEPLVGLLAAATVWMISCKSSPALPLAGVLAVKQYGFLWLPGMIGRLSRRGFLWAVALAGLVTLPFAAWDLRAFWFGVVEFQFYQPFREDALSIPAGIFRWLGWQLSSLLGLVAAGLVTVLVVRRRAVNVPLAAAAVFLALVLFSKQAFLNYYWLVQVFLTLAIGMAGGERPLAVTPTPLSTPVGQAGVSRDCDANAATL